MKAKVQFFSFLKTLDYEKEKKSLIQIFRLFRLPERSFLGRVEKHFDSFSKSFKKIEPNSPSAFELQDFNVILGTRRIHSVVQEWNKLTEKQKEIQKPRNIFLNTINSLMQRKEIQINEKNELEAKSQSGKILPLKFLSSGEKQLIIILGEALLQQSTPWVYIADEPELSLHVVWQEGLVRHLRDINPNAQIIFATHSPDIVSIFDNCVFDMEKYLL